MASDTNLMDPQTEDYQQTNADSLLEMKVLLKNINTLSKDDKEVVLSCMKHMKENKGKMSMTRLMMIGDMLSEIFDKYRE